MKISVIGTGIMGKSIVSYLSLFESVKEICWLGSNVDRAQSEFSSMSRVLKRIVRKQGGDSVSSIQKIVPVNQFLSLKESSLVIETVTEDYEIKKNVFNNLNNVIDSSVILASNTSSISITRLASNVENPARVIGVHFFNPIEIMELVEIVAGHHTSQETVDWIKKFLLYIQKKPICLNETPGFIVNRMMIPMINEAVTLLAEGVAIREDIDNAMKYGANHPIGPLSLSDLIGNDVVLSIMETLFYETNDPKYRPHPYLKKMVRAGCLGRKSKKGFYSY